MKKWKRYSDAGSSPLSRRRVPPANIDWNVLIPLLGQAAAAVARYDGTLSAIPNAAILLSPLTTQEAVLSSRIEGTQATMGEVLEYEAGAVKKDLPAGREDDIHEVLNYRKAMRRAEELRRGMPLCPRRLRSPLKHSNHFFRRLLGPMLTRIRGIASG